MSSFIQWVRVFDFVHQHLTAVVKMNIVLMTIEEAIHTKWGDSSPTKENAIILCWKKM